MKFDVVVLGGGSGGYVAGSVLARYGKKVAVVEKEKFGGICVRAGCVPSIFLYDTSFLFTRLGEIGNYKGMSIKVSLGDIFSSRENLIEYLSNAGRELIENAGGTTLLGEAKIKEGKVIVGRKEIEYDKLIIATGSSPSIPKIKGVEDGLTEDQAVNLDRVPENLVVVGGGFAGVEIAQFFARLGSTVTLLTKGKILKWLSEEARKVIKDSLEWDGVSVVENCEPVYQDKRFLKTTCGEFKAEVVYATGRKPNLPEGIDTLSIETNCNGIKVDESMRTTNGKVWAIGDVVDKERKVAHSAMLEGVIASLSILGKDVKVDRSFVPQVVYTDPQVAVVGKLERAVKSSVFPLKASTRAMIHGIREGYVRLGFDSDDKV
ncbi:MAG: FAD-dependent oxidoreductase, partial [Metallosphaera sp.]